MPFPPTDEQLAILGHPIERHARVLAGPGTGKSATIVALIDKVLSGENPPRLKLLTFTRAATAELALGVSEHPAAATQRPSTIHSFAISVLLRNEGAGDFPRPLRIADDWENSKIVYPSLARRAGFSVKVVPGLIREMSSGWESLQPDSGQGADATTRARFVGAWNEHRRVYGYTLLAELPYQLREALQNHDDLEGVDFDLLIVDEYQDLNACDLSVLRLISERGSKILGAGDDDQSIYGFRRAAPEGIRRFLEDYPRAADYPLSITQRCGRRIVAWANHVIAGDPGRPREREQLRAAASAPDGEVALLAFRGEVSEAKGVAAITRGLIDRDGLAPREILILVRADHNGTFSRPVKEQLDHVGVPYTDPDAVTRVFAEERNRQLLSAVRLLAEREDSLGWASILKLTPGIGSKFFDYVYDRARGEPEQFGRALLKAHAAGFPDGPASSRARASTAVRDMLSWLNAHPPPGTSEAWGRWIASAGEADTSIGPPSNELRELLLAVDDVAEAEQGLGRYLSQLYPLARDFRLAKSDSVRIMTMAGSKGLTVSAAILVGIEEGVMPRRDHELSEERRLLYVAMTRARQFLFCTWAKRRRGPTARAGRRGPTARVGEPRVNWPRRYSTFLDAGPVRSQNGDTFVASRWR